MEIPLNAHVDCTDGVCGRSKYVLINPIIDQVTHLVVKVDVSPNTEYIVPVSYITGTIADTIRLSCSQAELMKMEPFTTTGLVQERVPARIYSEGGGMYGMGTFYYLPYVSRERIVYESVGTQQIPTGELAMRRGTRVKATDGDVGHIDEFVVNPENNCITHIVMREGHLWHPKDVIIPVSALGATREDIVSLKLDKHQVEALPTFPINRRWS
jgi:hypothetical protein